MNRWDFKDHIGKDVSIWLSNSNIHFSGLIIAIDGCLPQIPDWLILKDSMESRIEIKIDNIVAIRYNDSKE